MAGTALGSSPAQAVSVSYADAVKLAAVLKVDGDHEAVEDFRYFWFISREPKLLIQAKVSFQLHLNFLSKNSLIQTVNDGKNGIVEIHPHLWRVDTDKFIWPKAALENARFIEVFFHRQRKAEEDTRVEGIHWPGGFDFTQKKNFKRGTYNDVRKKGETFPIPGEWLPPIETEGLRQLLYTESPVFCAEWFQVQTSRTLSLRNKLTGLNYPDILGFKDRDGFFRLARFRQADSEELETEIRAAQDRSGVSNTGRQLVRHEGGTGAVWVALDTEDPAEAGIAIENLESGTFNHNVEEYYLPLPNKLPAFGLFNKAGVLQTKAPGDNVGLGDKSDINRSNDIRIHEGTINCFGCHGSKVLKDIDDHVRNTQDGPLALALARKKKIDKARFERLQKQYFSDLEGAINDDREQYFRAIRKATRTPWTPNGLTPGQAVKVYTDTYYRYAADDVTVDDAARELGVEKQFFIDAIRWQASLKPEKKIQDVGLVQRLAPFARPKPRALIRQTWEDTYPVAQLILAKYAANKAAKGDK